MGPILENADKGVSKGGNEFIDVDEALGFEYPQQTSSYDERDLSIYALGVGAGFITVGAVERWAEAKAAPEDREAVDYLLLPMVAKKKLWIMFHRQDQFTRPGL